ncbi:MAG TPA: GxxExxY protein [Chthoniobacterales bacterium]|jgi:GxxExxY protein|nr:GxxExxY protein [Chthoniobacterales bacterium]
MLEPQGEHPDRLLHREITERIIGSAFEVYNELGYGFLERVYERSMQVELIKRGSKAEIEKRVQVSYKQIIVGDYDSDLVVDGCVLVELKVNPHYDKRDEAQLLNVLKATGIKVGLLVNFGRLKVEYKRLVF